jgi:hypothetical protein
MYVVHFATHIDNEGHRTSQSHIPFPQTQRALRSFMEEKVPKFNEEMRDGS